MNVEWKRKAKIILISPKASRKLCELLQPGLGAIFGPTSQTTANHVQSVSQALHLPYIETRWDQTRPKQMQKKCENCDPKRKIVPKKIVQVLIVSLGGNMIWLPQLTASTSTPTQDILDKLSLTLSKRLLCPSFLRSFFAHPSFFENMTFFCSRWAGGAW